MEEIRDRIKQIIDYEELTDGAFARSINVSQATISHIMSGRNKNPSTDVLQSICTTYSNVNPAWLLTGCGEMLLGGGNSAYGKLPSDSDEPNLFSSPDIIENSQSGPDALPSNMAKSVNEEAKENIVPEIVYRDRPVRKITEIRIFFDDNTYETFIPQKK